MDGLSFLEMPGRLLAHGAYPDFRDPGRIFNQPPPTSTTSFIIGGVLMVVSIAMFAFRVKKLMGRKLIDERHELVRGIIGCAIDNDSPYYTITSYAAVAFLFLGGIQEDYQTTFLAMIVYYFIAAFGDSLKVVMAVCNYKSLSDVLLFNSMGPGVQEKKLEEKREMHMQNETMELQPKNIYEDLGREKTIVMMIFITQVVFISFVCVDVYRKPTTNCLDGTSGCPVGGTLGSYGFYIMGVFQACVYLLGPKTSFGQSEQNPGYWLVLLLATKKNGAKLLWENPVKDPYHSDPSKVSTLKDTSGNIIQDPYHDPPRDKLYFCRELKKHDSHIWCRFVMSYLINGVGFHILVHALPIQVASQGSLIGVVFRAVGMMYLVDLDDTAGLKLTIVENKAPSPEEAGGDDGGAGGGEGLLDTAQEPLLQSDDQETLATFDDEDENAVDKPSMESEAAEIIEEATRKLEELAKNGPRKKQASTLKAGVMTFGYNGVGTLGGKAVKTPADATAAATLQGSEVADGVSGGGETPSGDGGALEGDEAADGDATGSGLDV